MDGTSALFHYVTVIKVTILDSGKWMVSTADGTVNSVEFIGSRLGALQEVIALRKELETEGHPFRIEMPGK